MNPKTRLQLMCEKHLTRAGITVQAARGALHKSQVELPQCKSHVKNTIFIYLSTSVWVPIVLICNWECARHCWRCCVCSKQYYCLVPEGTNIVPLVPPEYPSPSTLYECSCWHLQIQAACVVDSIRILLTMMGCGILPGRLKLQKHVLRW